MPGDSDKPVIFISHSHQDWRVAERLQKLLEEISSHTLDVQRSSEKGSIKTGESWRQWIDQNVLNCDVAIVLLTPSSLRGRWVMWEAGAVAGVQFERTKGLNPGSDDPGARRVRVIQFRMRGVDLGPFSGGQTADGLDEVSVRNLVLELMQENMNRVGLEVFTKAATSAERMAREFVEGAGEDLKYTPVNVDEPLVQAWLQRLDTALAEDDYQWVAAAERWINVAFLGANNAEPDDPEPIDFRIHTRLAEAYQNLGQWRRTEQQLSLAASASPNDLLILRQLGQAQNKQPDMADAVLQTLDKMQVLDPTIFEADREAIALKCGYLANLPDYRGAVDLLKAAKSSLVNNDGYLLGWRAISEMLVGDLDAARTSFEALENLMVRKGHGFWDEASLINALLALDKREAAEAALTRLVDYGRPRADMDSATKRFDDIVGSFKTGFAWRDLIPQR